jgi:hypothetical protein
MSSARMRRMLGLAGACGAAVTEAMSRLSEKSSLKQFMDIAPKLLDSRRAIVR